MDFILSVLALGVHILSLWYQILHSIFLDIRKLLYNVYHCSERNEIVSANGFNSRSNLKMSCRLLFREKKMRLQNGSSKQTGSLFEHINHRIIQIKLQHSTPQQQHIHTPHSLLQWFKNENVQKIDLKKHDKFCIVGDRAAEISANNTVPCSAQAFVTFLFNLGRNILSVSVIKEEDVRIWMFGFIGGDPKTFSIVFLSIASFTYCTIRSLFSWGMLEDFILSCYKQFI